jgi:hypothetical protein
MTALSTATTAFDGTYAFVSSTKVNETNPNGSHAQRHGARAPNGSHVQL